jgi:small subunit ribosomal protein S15
MARIHAHRKGKSHSTRPMKPDAKAPWVTLGKGEVTSLIVKMSKDGLTPSEIGVKLRDEYAIPLAKSVLDKSIMQILEEEKASLEIPEDLDMLVKKAIGLQKHLRTHKSDRNNVRSLELLEAKVHRLSRYYKREGRLPQQWRYAAVVAKLE